MSAADHWLVEAEAAYAERNSLITVGPDSKARCAEANLQRVAEVGFRMLEAAQRANDVATHAERPDVHRRLARIGVSVPDYPCVVDDELHRIMGGEA